MNLAHPVDGAAHPLGGFDAVRSVPGVHLDQGTVVRNNLFNRRIEQVQYQETVCPKVTAQTGQRGLLLLWAVQVHQAVRGTDGQAEVRMNQAKVGHVRLQQERLVRGRYGGQVVPGQFEHFGTDVDPGATGMRCQFHQHAPGAASCFKDRPARVPCQLLQERNVRPEVAVVPIVEGAEPRQVGKEILTVVTHGMEIVVRRMRVWTCSGTVGRLSFRAPWAGCEGVFQASSGQAVDCTDPLRCLCIGDRSGRPAQCCGITLFEIGTPE